MYVHIYRLTLKAITLIIIRLTIGLHFCFFSPDWKQNLKDGVISPKGVFQTLTQRTPAGRCVSLEPNPAAYGSRGGTASLASWRQGSYYQWFSLHRPSANIQRVSASDARWASLLILVLIFSSEMS